MEIKYNDYTITESGNVYLNGVNVKTSIGKYGDTTLVVDSIKYRLESFIGFNLFKIDRYHFVHFNFGHINGLRIDNSFANIKAYLKTDKKNKSGKYIAMHDGVPYVYEGRNPSYPFTNVRQFLNLREV